MQTLKYIGVGIIGVVVGLLLTGAVKGDSLEGVYSEVVKDFSQGISVDGTVVIDGDGNVDAPITSSTGSFTGALTVTGEATFLESNNAVSTSTTLTVADSNTVLYVTTGGTTTLPAVGIATGSIYRIVIAGATATDTKLVSAEGDNLEGSLIVAGVAVDCDAVDEVNILADGENLGDTVTVRSNGQKWFITDSNALTSGKMTCSG